MHYAHSLQEQDKGHWQQLRPHLQAVSALTAARARKFGAERLGALVGLLHDLGKYSREFQDYIAEKGTSPDHATAGAREILTLAAAGGPDRLAALIGAYCIAGHHAGLPNWSGDRPLSERLGKSLPPLDPVWRGELAPQMSDLFPKAIKPHADRSLFAFQLAMLGRMVFSCLVDAGARIETHANGRRREHRRVAPHAGARIETHDGR